MKRPRWDIEWLMYVSLDLSLLVALTLIQSSVEGTVYLQADIFCITKQQSLLSTYITASVFGLLSFRFISLASVNLSWIYLPLIHLISNDML